MKIFVTGATGFIGSFVVADLLSGGHEIAILLKSDTSPWRIDGIKDRLKIIEGDLKLPISYKDPLIKFGPDIVIHLAWYGVGGSERNNPAQFENILDAIELIKICIEAEVSAFVGLGSQAEYGNINMRADESVPTNPTHMYGAAKLATFHLASKLAEISSMRFVWLRLFSSYGPGDNPGWFIPSLITGAMQGRNPGLTRCEQTWDYIHVRDVASAIRAVSICPNAIGVYNLGSGAPVILSDIVEEIGQILNFSFELGGLPYRPDQVMHLEANIDKLKRDTGWIPKEDLKLGIREAVEWWKHQLNQVGTS
jgi:UDP-glucose 4-epimerase